MLPIPIARTAAAAAVLVLTALCLGACAGTASTLEARQPDLARLPCQNTVAAAWQNASELRQYFTDHHGHDVEVWCYRGIVRSHWDVRVGWDELDAQRAVHRTATIAGCFFDDGQSTGPAIIEDADHRYIRVEWTNQDPANQHKSYRFSYDFATGKVTITGIIPGSPPVTRVVAAQGGWDEMKAQLPFPPD